LALAKRRSEKCLRRNGASSDDFGHFDLHEAESAAKARRRRATTFSSARSASKKAFSSYE
jgi:hypothetical protein